MMRYLLMIPLCSAIGCASVTPASHSAICDGTRAARASHAAALAVSPDDRAVATGADLISKIDAGCAT